MIAVVLPVIKMPTAFNVNVYILLFFLLNDNSDMCFGIITIIIQMIQISLFLYFALFFFVYSCSLCKWHLGC